jgi:DedD protein
MGLMAMFRRAPEAAETATKGKRAARQQAADHEATVQRLRLQARRRLLGAAVLVGLAIVAFPLVFETQPRPVPMDLPIVIPSREAAQGVSVRAPEPALPASLPDDAEAQAAEVEPTPARAEPEPPAPVQAMAATAAPAPPPQGASQPEALARFVVQVGAFADRGTAQEARRKLEARGLKTYTQVAKTKEGDRIRVRLGPFAQRAEADKVAAKAKAIGLAGTVLSL